MASSGPIVLFVGPRGVSAERAIGQLRTVSDPDPYPLDSPERVLETVDATPEVLGLLAWEEAPERNETAALDLLAFSSTRCTIRETTVLTEVISAWARPGSGAPRAAVSHPLLLGACRRFVESLGLDALPAPSSEAACQRVASGSDERLVALAPACVAERYGLVELERSVTAAPDLRTRYALIGQGILPPTGDDQTMLAVVPRADRPGALYELLAEISGRGVDLASLRSRAVADDEGQNVCFFLELHGHLEDGPVREAVVGCLRLGSRVRLLGCYPRWTGAPVQTPLDRPPRAMVDGRQGSAEERFAELRAALLASRT